MTGTSDKSAFFEGLIDGLPFFVVVLPFALLFGVVASEAGLNLWEAMVLTSLVVAGASQFAAIQLMIEEAAPIMVIITALTVNMRMAMYSAAMVPHLGGAPLGVRALLSFLLVDQVFATATRRYEIGAPMTLDEKIAYYFGVLVPIVPTWMLFSYVGAVVGETIPDRLALDFALPIAFIAMVTPLIRTWAHGTAAAVSVVVALVLSDLPAGSGLMIAAVCAMCAGAAVETWQESRGA